MPSSLTAHDHDYAALIRHDRVAARMYIDEAVFRDEMDRIFDRTWVYVGHESEIAEPNRFVTRMLGRSPVILTRDRSGQIHLLQNRCTHRGNTVCQVASGSATAFRCAYHGWNFSNNGALLGATFPAGYGPDFDKADLGLGRVPRVGSYRGFIFGSMAPEGPSLEEHLGHARPFIDQFVDFAPEGHIELSSGAIKSRLRGNWKLPMENAVDGYHPPFLHRGVMVDRGASDVKVAEELTRSVDLGGGHALLDFRGANAITLAGATESRVPVIPVHPGLEAANDEHRRLLEQRLGPEVGGKVFRDGLSNLAVFPNLAFVRGDVRMIVPVSANETEVYQFPATFVGAPDLINHERLRWEVAAYGAAGMVGSDDSEAYERTQDGLRSGLDEWVIMSRGLHNEQVDDLGLRSSGLTDETAQRAFWREHRRLMTRSPQTLTT